MAFGEIGNYVLFALVAAITPGPSNVMIVATGAAAGLRRGFLCALGAALGMALLMFMSAIGLGGLLLDHPVAVVVMKWAGAAFLLWLAFKIATSPPLKSQSQGEEERRGVGLFGAILFQFVNPKSWLVAISAAGAYAGLGPVDPTQHAALMGGLFFLVAFPSGLVWLFAGSLISATLGDSRQGRIANIVMGLLLAVSVLFIF